MRTLVVSLALIAISTAAANSAVLENVHLQWRPTSALQARAVAVADVSIQFDKFQDGRAGRPAIGENLEDATPKPVTTVDDVGAFVSLHMRELFERTGLKSVDDNGAVRIKGEIRQFFVRETTTYRAEVAVHLSVVDREGRSLWDGIASGDATRFGRSYRLENYEEVLSDAVVDAVNVLLQNGDFIRALSGRAR